MNVILFIGSGHSDSTSFKIGKIIAEKLSNHNCEVEIIELSRWDIRDCLGCDYCKTHQGKCIINDQMQEIYPKLNTAEVICFISPVYFSNFPATIKRVIDRCQLYFNLIDKSEIKEKQFYAVHLGGANAYPAQFEALKLTYQVLTPDLKATMNAFISIPGTDRISPLEDESVIHKLEKLVKNILKTKEVWHENFKYSGI